MRDRNFQKEPRYANRLVASFIMVWCSACYQPPIGNLAVWSEFLPLAEVAPSVPALAERGVDLYLAVAPADINDELVTFLTNANADGLNVTLWLQLPDNGIWLNETNATAFRSFTTDVLDWADANEITLQMLIYDIEPAFEYAEELAATIMTEGPLGFFDLLQTRQDMAAYLEARNTITAMVEDIQVRGVQAMAVVLPWAINDPRDGDDDLQDVLDTPVTGIPWDRVSVILYRSSIGELVGLPLSPAFVYEYAVEVRRQYGDSAQIAIGTIGTPGLVTTAGYTDPLDIALDVMAIKAAGLSDVSVFSLDGMLLEGGIDRWLDAASGPTVAVPIIDPLAGLVPFLFDLADGVLDE